MKPRPTVNEKNKYYDESVKVSESIKQSIYDSKKSYEVKAEQVKFVDPNFASLHIEYKATHFTLVFDSEECSKISVFATCDHDFFNEKNDSFDAPMRWYNTYFSYDVNPEAVQETMISLYKRLCDAYGILL